MIRFLPTPYPDELLWSVLARATRRLRNPSHGSIAKVFSNSRTATAVVDLPSGLDHFCAQIGSEHRNLDVEQILAKHTMLPLYAPFFWRDRLLQVEADMRGEGRGATIHLEAGIMASRVRVPARMRHCPQCLAEDFRLYGESYWRRVHQAPGVEVCPHHAVFLISSRVQRVNRQTRHAYHGVPHDEPTQLVESLNLNNPEHTMLLQVSRDAHWLLNENRSWAQAENLRRVYREELSARGLATRNGRLRLAALNEAICNLYPDALLARLQCKPSADGAMRWLPRLLRSRRAAQSPIYHLVLINFLGTCAQSLFTRLAGPGPFGPPRWPCLNPVCRWYGQDTISYCKIGQDNRGVILGTFLCTDCDYTYTRRGPDRNKLVKNSVAWVVRYGPRWESELENCWADQKLSLRGIARRLGVDPLTVKRVAAKLSLQFPRPGKRLVNKERVHTRCAASVRLSADQGRHRFEWQNLVHQHPEFSRSQLRRLLPTSYMWLYRHDHEWLLNEASPSRHAKTRSLKSADCHDAQGWVIRDNIENVRVSPLARQMQSEPGKPQYISKAALARRLGITAWVQKHADKLPVTVDALNKFSETRETFALRRIAYALASNQWHSGAPVRWRLLRLAGIRKEISAKPAIQRSINHALMGMQPAAVHLSSEITRAKV